MKVERLLGNTAVRKQRGIDRKRMARRKSIQNGIGTGKFIPLIGGSAPCSSSLQEF
jgi:hypothetical protein